MPRICSFKKLRLVFRLGDTTIPRRDCSAACSFRLVAQRWPGFNLDVGACTLIKIWRCFNAPGQIRTNYRSLAAISTDKRQLREQRLVLIRLETHNGDCRAEGRARESGIGNRPDPFQRHSWRRWVVSFSSEASRAFVRPRPASAGCLSNCCKAPEVVGAPIKRIIWYSSCRKSCSRMRVTQNSCLTLLSRFAFAVPRICNVLLFIASWSLSNNDGFDLRHSQSICDENSVHLVFFLSCAFPSKPEAYKSIFKNNLLLYCDVHRVSL